MKPERGNSFIWQRRAIAHELLARRETNRVDARNALRDYRDTLSYKIADVLHKDPRALTESRDEDRAIFDPMRCEEDAAFNFYRSNEYHNTLATELQGLGGVGITVGSDQCLDFYTMASLEQVYNIDISEHAHTIIRTYLEIGSRLHRILGRYPTTNEYLSSFNNTNWQSVLDMLSQLSATHTFQPDEIEWLKSHYDQDRLEKNTKYLNAKKKFYRGNSWIGSDDNLRHVIEGYEEGKIHIAKGDIFGVLLPEISERIKQDGLRVSLIYTSNAPMYGEKPIRAIKSLPISDTSRVLFSTADLALASVNPPPTFEHMQPWTFIFFSPDKFNRWPEFNERKFSRIKNGVYEAVI